MTSKRNRNYYARYKMKKLYLTICALLFSSTVQHAWAQMTLNSNFYGQGYYRIINLNTARMIEVVGDVVPAGSEIMKSVNMKSVNPAQMHDITSSAGSVVAIKPAKSAFDGTWDMNAQGVGTYYLTASNELVQNLIQLVAGSAAQNAGVGVRIAESMDFGNGISQGGFTLAGKAYTAHIDLWDIAPYMSFRGTRRAYFCDNNGQGSGGYTDLKDFALYANLSGNASATLPTKTNWLIVPMEDSFNYYTPTYSNAAGDGYVNVDGYNWATVYVDFPFRLPTGAVAYTVDESLQLSPIDMTQYDYIPSRAKVLLKWPAASAQDELHIVPGYLTAQQLAQCEAARQTRYNELAAEEVSQQQAQQIQAMLTSALGDEGFKQFVFGDDYQGTPTEAEVLQAIRMKFSDLDKINRDLEALLNNVMLNQAENSEYQGYLAWYDEADPDRDRKAAVIFTYVQFFGGNVSEGQKDDTLMMQYRIMLEINGSYLQARQDKAYSETYGVAYGAAIANEEGYRNQLNRNSGLYWCGDFFAFTKGYSTQEGNAPAFDNVNSLTGVDNDVPNFSNPVTAWQGNVLYNDQSSHSLQWIVNNGNPGDIYKVIDKLQLMLVFAPDYGKFVVYVKDDNNFRDKDVMQDGLRDYMETSYFNTYNAQLDTTFGRYARTAGYDQSNWLRADVASDLLPSDLRRIAERLTQGPEQFVSNGFFYYVNNAKVRMTNKERVEGVIEGADFEKIEQNLFMREAFNTYIPAHFYETNVQKGFFFNRPKVNEVAIFNWGVFDGDRMLMPKYDYNPNTQSYYNRYDLKGGYTLDYTMVDQAGSGTMGFVQGEAYEFFGVIGKYDSSNQAAQNSARRIEGDAEGLSNEYFVYPIYSESYAPQVVTGVNTVSAGKQPAAVQYVNLAGQRSSRPWQGVNIVVTRYTDGTCRSAKAIY